jgi:integrase/recombinase XerD
LNIVSENQLIKEFINYMSDIEGVSDNTVKSYKQDLKLFNEFIISEHNAQINKDTIKNIDLNILHEFISYSKQERDNCDSTRARKVACLKSFFNYLLNVRGIIVYNPALQLKTPKIGKKVVQHLSKEEAVMLIRCVSGRYEERDRAILTLFLNTGMRLSELINLNLEDINDKEVIVRGKGNKERVLYLNESCLEALKKYLPIRKRSDETNALFTSERETRLSDKGIDRIVKKYLQKINKGHLSCHKLRHSVLTWLVEDNVNLEVVRMIAGHTSLNTTQKYLHVSDKAKEKAMIGLIGINYL